MIELWQHQKDAIKYMHQHKSALLQVGVACGKTLTTLHYILEAGYKRVLIVGTKRSCQTWYDQTQQYMYPFHVSVYDNGLVRQRTKQLREDWGLWTGTHQISVVNYEGFIREPFFSALMKLQFDCVVFDEVHRLRNWRSQQSKKAYQFAKAHPNAYRIGLTGTLLYNHPLDVFGIFRFIDPTVFGIRWTDFKETYAVWGGQFGQIPLRYINQDQLKQLVIKNSFIIDRRSVLSLPEEQHIYVDVHLDKKDQDVYNEFNKEYVTELNEKTVTAKNILDKVNKLQQLSGGFIYNDGQTHPFSNAKAEALGDLLDEFEDHVVVFYKYQAALDIIRRTAEKQSYKVFSINGTESTYRDWLACTDKSVLAVQIKSGAEGIDLTKSYITIFYDMVHTYGTYEQALGRTARTNQKASSLLYYYLVAHDTIDTEIVKALKEKVDLIDYIIKNNT